MFRPRTIALIVAGLTLSVGFAALPASADSPSALSYVGLVGDASCDFPQPTGAESEALVNLGLDAITQSAPAQLIVTSVRSNARTTVKPSMVTLTSALHGSTPRQRDLRKQRQAVRVAPLVRALTTPPGTRCGSDLINSIRALRDIAAGGTDRRVPGAMTIVLLTNGVEVEPELRWPQWYEGHRGSDPAGLARHLIHRGLGQDLHGVQIIVVGLGRVRTSSGVVSGVSDQEFRALESFWKAYVTQCGGYEPRFVPTVSMLAGGAR